MRRNFTDYVIPVLGTVLIGAVSRDAIFTAVSAITLASFSATSRNPRVKIIGGIGLIAGLIIGYFFL
jgi:hypothetical protein